MRHTTPEVKKEEGKEGSKTSSETFEIMKKEEFEEIKDKDFTPKKEEYFQEDDLSGSQRNPIQSCIEPKSSANIYHSKYTSENLDTGKEGRHLNKTKAKGATSAKNIIKNYGLALLNFAISNMSLPYIRPILEQEKVTLSGFRRYLSPKKKEVRSIAGLRSLLLILENEDVEIARYKRVFQKISIIFIKFFSVNWIFSGKLLNKTAHLKCRFKILRRIREPESFTYLKGFM